MIPVYNQVITKQDAEAVYQTVLSQFVTHIGRETSDLELHMAKRFNRKHALACSNGTTALHLALVALRLEGKTIAVPACAFAAVAFAPAYVNCDTVFIDVSLNTWNIDLNLLEEECKARKIDAVIAVHNYGNPYDYNRLKDLSERYKFFIIEDACEAMGSTYFDMPTGKLGDVSVFSFYGNKVVTGGEGGILLTDLDHVKERAELFRGQALSKNRRFWHEDVGHNFRITNMQSSLILSQMSRIDDTLKHIATVKEEYEKRLSHNFNFQKVLPGCHNCWWMISVTNDNSSYDEMSRKLSDHDIDSRPVFRTIPYMPAWSSNNRKKFPVSEYLETHGISLPSGPGLTISTIRTICQILNQF